MMKDGFSKAKRFLGLALSLCILALALAILHRVTRNITWEMVTDAVAGTSWRRILLAAAATFVSFCCLAVYEMIAVKAALGRKLAWQVPTLAGAGGNAVSNTLGFHAVTISALRYRIYTEAGLSIGDITRITGIGFIGVALGFVSITGLCLLLDPQASSMRVPGLPLEPALGILLICLIAGFVLWSGLRPRSFTLKGWPFTLPGACGALQQIATGLIDLACTSYATYILLPAHAMPSFAHFTLIYIGSALFGIASHAPGGLGVFEAAMMTSLAPNGDAAVLASLLLYRLIYNLAPFVIACMMIAASELRRKSVR